MDPAFRMRGVITCLPDCWTGDLDWEGIVGLQKVVDRLVLAASAETIWEKGFGGRVLW